MAKRTNAQNKTRPRTADVRRFLAGVTPEGRREDALELLAMMEDVTGEPATLWGPSIVGFGRYRYVYESGREGEHLLTGFAPRKANLVVYIMPGFSRYSSLLAKLGKFKVGKSCLYLGRLSNVDTDVLRELVARSVRDMRKKYPTS